VRRASGVLGDDVIGDVLRTLEINGDVGYPARHDRPGGLEAVPDRLQEPLRPEVHGVEVVHDSPELGDQVVEPTLRLRIVLFVDRSRKISAERVQHLVVDLLTDPYRLRLDVVEQFAATRLKRLDFLLQLLDVADQPIERDPQRDLQVAPCALLLVVLGIPVQSVDDRRHLPAPVARQRLERPHDAHADRAVVVRQAGEQSCVVPGLEPSRVLLDVGFYGQEVVVDESRGLVVGVGLGFQPSARASGGGRAEVEKKRTRRRFRLGERRVDVLAPLYCHW